MTHKITYWGWGPGDQETAEFKILEAYFIAAFNVGKRIREIEHPRYPHNLTGSWKLIFTDNTTLELQ